MSSFSLTSWPMRCMGWPHSGLGQAVSAGSWWCSTRSRCSGRAWRLGLARGTEARLGVSGRPAPQRRQLRLQAGLVLDDGLFEQAPLLGAHRLGLGGELPALVARDLEFELLDLGIAKCEIPILALQQRGALGQRGFAFGGFDLVLLDALAHLLERGEDFGADFDAQALQFETSQVRRGKTTHAEHALHRARARRAPTIGECDVNARGNLPRRRRRHVDCTCELRVRTTRE
jgi:hypothetical protein